MKGKERKGGSRNVRSVVSAGDLDLIKILVPFDAVCFDNQRTKADRWALGLVNHS